MRHVLGVLLFVFSGSAAGAGAFCEQVEALLEGGPTVDEVRLPNGSGSQCSTSLGLSGATAVNCAWPHTFRDGSARAAFDEALVALQTCVGGQSAATRDQDVNHPDYYDLRLFRTDKGEVGLSLKDKGALQQTYVFLRVTPVK